MKTVVEFNNAKKRKIGGRFASAIEADQILVDGQWENIECYAGDEPCPSCKVGLIYGADFPNGDNKGTCLNCGEEWEWNNELGEWE